MPPDRKILHCPANALRFPGVLIFGARRLGEQFWSHVLGFPGTLVLGFPIVGEQFLVNSPRCCCIADVYCTCGGVSDIMVQHVSFFRIFMDVLKIPKFLILKKWVFAFEKRVFFLESRLRARL